MAREQEIAMTAVVIIINDTDMRFCLTDNLPELLEACRGLAEKVGKVEVIAMVEGTEEEARAAEMVAAARYN